MLKRSFGFTVLDITKIITSSILIGPSPFSKHKFTNFVGYNFTSGSELGLCSEDFGLWLALSGVHENKLKIHVTEKGQCQSQSFSSFEKS